MRGSESPHIKVSVFGRVKENNRKKNAERKKYEDLRDTEEKDNWLIYNLNRITLKFCK